MRSLGLGAAAAAGRSSPAAASSVIRAAWRAVRRHVVVPGLQLAVYVCAAMSLMLFLERLCMAAVVAGLWLQRRHRKRPRRCRRRLSGNDDVRKRVLDDDEDDDLLESAGEDRRCPMVLVQIPMFNEKQVSNRDCSDYCSRFAFRFFFLLL